MIDIFSSLRRADDETIAMQTALLQSITVANITKPYAQKAGVKAVQAVKWLAAKLDKQVNAEAPQVTELQELIDENYRRMRTKSRAELDAIMREELKKRIHDEDVKGRVMEFISRKSNAAMVAKDDMALSEAIINEAAKSFSGIGDNFTVEQKADAVAREFHNRIREELSEQLKKQTAEQSAETERLIDREIERLSGNEKIAMQKALRVDELTGKTVRSAVLTAGLPAFVLGTTSGAGLFVATSTIMHAVFTTMLGVTLPFAAYSGAASLLSVLTGPVGWALIAGTAAFQVVSGNNKIDREMLALFIYLAYICEECEYKEKVDNLSAEISVLRKSCDKLVERLERHKRNTILRNEEIRRMLINTIDNAKFEIDVMSPWMNRHVVDDVFIAKLKNAINRGVSVKIRYGIGAASLASGKEAERQETTQRAVDRLRQEIHFDRLVLLRGNEHSKLFICDEAYYVITSFNPLSFDGDYSDQDQRGEIGEMSTDKDNLKTYRRYFFSGT